MKINVSNATFSSIVGIGQKVKKASLDTGEKYIELNRGVNAVTEIDLSGVMSQIDVNAKSFQVYAPNLGLESFRKAIAKEYFPSQASQSGFENNIAITPGGMPALDLVIQILNVENILFPKFYWGSYSKMATIRNKKFSFYEQLDDLEFEKLNDSTCVFICDPNNPTGMKLDDEYLYENIKKIASTGAIVIFDSPYRKLFYENDTFFDKIAVLDNVIVTESFSKWVGLSGLRMGFIFTKNKSFNSELNIRLLYEFNAVSAPAQLIIEQVITSEVGRNALDVFQKETTSQIAKNIQFLKQHDLLVKEIYGEETPMGIFAIIKLSEDFLFQHKIGAVGLDKFVYHDKDTWSSYARICVSVQHELFVEFMSKVI
jgi:aspartate/methionine/tyrosine aminotransferase